MPVLHGSTSTSGWDGDRCHYTSHQFGERLLVRVEELRAWTEGLRTILRLALRTHVARRVAWHSLCGLSIVPVKEIFTSQAGPMDQLTGSNLDLEIVFQLLIQTLAIRCTICVRL